MTPAVYAGMHKRCTRLAEGLRKLIDKRGLAWCVTQVGARCEFQFCATPPRNGSEAAAAMDGELEQALHLFLLNRGVLITPFHNMMLVCPDTSEADVQMLLGAFEEALEALAALLD
jgi:glutamate-1-semialdehyde 2,1-aminomutase